MKTKRVLTAALTPEQTRSMYEVMIEYYHGMSYETFRHDLVKTDAVILLKSNDGLIQGFSTLNRSELEVDGRRVLAIFSGDTVLRRKYWGNGALASAFGTYLLITRLQNLRTHVYWFLTSKGYRTYLLMTNNFRDHYPRVEASTPPEIKRLMDRYYGDRFGTEYRADLGLVIPSESNPCRLRETVAVIGEKEMANPRIAYFSTQNPEWESGRELACVARVSMRTPIYYVWKRARRVLFSKSRLRPQSAVIAPS